MKRRLLLLLAIISFSIGLQSSTKDVKNIKQPISNNLEELYFEKYTELEGKKPDYSVFLMAMRGFEKLKAQRKVSDKNILSVIDYRLSSNQERLWIIDLDQNKVLYNILVAHGMNSGEEYALQFSNNHRSWQSSLGFFVTGETYTGKHGLSLRLNGVEENINDNAMERAIVMHGANYVSYDFIEKHGRLGRSFGCPAISYPMHEEIISLLDHNTCIFVYSNRPRYIAQSPLLLAQ